MQKLSIETHLARGTYRADRHGPLGHRQEPETAADCCDQNRCCDVCGWKFTDVYVNHLSGCGRGPTDADVCKDRPPITEADLLREMGYERSRGYGANRDAALRALEVRRVTNTPEEYRKILDATFRQRSAGVLRPK